MKVDDRKKLIELLTEARVEVAAARHEIVGCKRRCGDPVRHGKEDNRPPFFLTKVPPMEKK